MDVGHWFFEIFPMHLHCVFIFSDFFFVLIENWCVETTQIYQFKAELKKLYAKVSMTQPQSLGWWIENGSIVYTINTIVTFFNQIRVIWFRDGVVYFQK